METTIDKETTTNYDELVKGINESSAEDDEVAEKNPKSANKKYFLKETFSTIEKANEYVLSQNIWRHTKNTKT